MYLSDNILLGTVVDSFFLRKRDGAAAAAVAERVFLDSRPEKLAMTMYGWDDDVADGHGRCSGGGESIMPVRRGKNSPQNNGFFDEGETPFSSKSRRLNQSPQSFVKVHRSNLIQTQEEDRPDCNYYHHHPRYQDRGDYRENPPPTRTADSRSRNVIIRSPDRHQNQSQHFQQSHQRPPLNERQLRHAVRHNDWQYVEEQEEHERRLRSRWNKRREELTLPTPPLSSSPSTKNVSTKKRRANSPSSPSSRKKPYTSNEQPSPYYAGHTDTAADQRVVSWRCNGEGRIHNRRDIRDAMNARDHPPPPPPSGMRSSSSSSSSSSQQYDRKRSNRQYSPRDDGNFQQHEEGGEEMRFFHPHRHSCQTSNPYPAKGGDEEADEVRNLPPPEEAIPPVHDDSAITRLPGQSNIQSDSQSINQSNNCSELQSNSIPPQDISTSTSTEEAVCKSEEAATTSSTADKGGIRTFHLTKLVFPELGGTGPLSVSTKNNRGVGALMVSFESISLKILHEVLEMSEEDIRERIPTLRKVVKRPLSQPWFVKGRVSKAEAELSLDEFTYEHSLEYLQSLRRSTTGQSEEAEDAQTEDAQTEEAQTEKAQTEEAQTEVTQSLGGGCAIPPHDVWVDLYPARLTTHYLDPKKVQGDDPRRFQPLNKRFDFITRALLWCLRSGGLGKEKGGKRSRAVHRGDSAMEISVELNADVMNVWLTLLQEWEKHISDLRLKLALIKEEEGEVIGTEIPNHMEKRGNGDKRNQQQDDQQRVKSEDDDGRMSSKDDDGQKLTECDRGLSEISAFFREAYGDDFNSASERSHDSSTVATARYPVESKRTLFLSTDFMTAFEHALAPKRKRSRKSSSDYTPSNGFEFACEKVFKYFSRRGLNPWEWDFVCWPINYMSAHWVLLTFDTATRELIWSDSYRKSYVDALQSANGRGGGIAAATAAVVSPLSRTLKIDPNRPRRRRVPLRPAYDLQKNGAGSSSPLALGEPPQSPSSQDALSPASPPTFCNGTDPISMELLALFGEERRKEEEGEEEEEGLIGKDIQEPPPPPPPDLAEKKVIPDEEANAKARADAAGAAAWDSTRSNALRFGGWLYFLCAEEYLKYDYIKRNGGAVNLSGKLVRLAIN